VFSSKESDYFFSRLLRWEKTASLNSAFCALLEQDFRAAFSSTKTHPVQELTAMSLAGAAYQHFGFPVFGPIGRAMVSTQIASLSGLSTSSVAQWLELVAYSLLEDLNVLQVVTGEPDWLQVDLSFSMELWKRLFCSDENESSSLGLDCLDGDEISRLRKLAVKAVSLMGKSGIEEDKKTATPLPNDLGDAHLRTFKTVAASAAGNPIMLLLWRIEVFSLLKETRHEYKFRVKVDSEQLLPMLSALAGVLMVLSPVASNAGVPLFPESPLTQEEIEHYLGVHQSPRLAKVRDPLETPYIGVLKDWIGDDCRDKIDQVLALGCSYGLIFSISIRPGKPAYGLTAKGSQTLTPFLAILGELLCPPSEPRGVTETKVNKSSRSSNSSKGVRVTPVLSGRSRSEVPSQVGVVSPNLKKPEQNAHDNGTQASGADGFMNELSVDLVQTQPGNVRAEKLQKKSKIKSGARQ
jgi:hypothetical protein